MCKKFPHKTVTSFIIKLKCPNYNSLQLSAMSLKRGIRMVTTVSTLLCTATKLSVLNFRPLNPSDYVMNTYLI